MASGSIFTGGVRPILQPGTLQADLQRLHKVGLSLPNRSKALASEVSACVATAFAHHLPDVLRALVTVLHTLVGKYGGLGSASNGARLIIGHLKTAKARLVELATFLGVDPAIPAPPPPPAPRQIKADWVAPSVSK